MYKTHYIVKIRNTRRDEYRIVLTPAFFTDYEAIDFVKTNKYFDKYDDVIIESYAIFDLR